MLISNLEYLAPLTEDSNLEGGFFFPEAITMSEALLGDLLSNANQLQSFFESFSVGEL